MPSKATAAVCVRGAAQSPVAAEAALTSRPTRPRHAHVPPAATLRGVGQPDQRGGRQLLDQNRFIGGNSMSTSTSFSAIPTRNPRRSQRREKTMKAKWLSVCVLVLFLVVARTAQGQTL